MIINKKKYLRPLFIGLFVYLTFFWILPVSAQVTLPQPYFLFPRETNQTAANSQPVLRGETQNDTTVEIYIDNKLVGQAEVINGPLFTAYFTYQPTDSLRSGDHQVQALAKDKNNSSLTSTSNKEHLRIVPFPAPTLFPLINKSDQFILTGVAKNDSLVTIYLDNYRQTNFLVTNHSSGTAAFSWQLPKELSPEKHTLHATARDLDGKLSLNSNVITYQPFTPTETVKIKPSETALNKEPKVIVETTTKPLTPKVESTEIVQPEIKITEPSPISLSSEKQITPLEQESVEKSWGRLKFWLTVLTILIILAFLRWLKNRIVAQKKDPSSKPPTAPKIPPANSINPPTEPNKKTVTYPSADSADSGLPFEQSFQSLPKEKIHPTEELLSPKPPEETPPPLVETPSDNQLHYPF